MKNNNYNIGSLSPNIKKLITSFQTPEDALAFPNISMNIREDSSLRVTNSTSYGLTNQKWYGGTADGDRERIWFRCIPISQVQIHTIQFECDFQDQGWGNRKGQLYIREDKSENEYDGPIVAISPIAEHHETPLKLTFQPKPGKNYTMCYKVGGGGGHVLIVRNPSFHQLLYSDEGVESLRIWCPNNIGSLSPHIKKLITSFLTPDGALAFPNISINIREDLSLRMTNSTSYGLTNQKWHGGYADGDRERIWFRCIPISQDQIHAIQFECYFKDQGWGNRKGQLYIREDKSENEYDGPIVAISPIAEHHETPLKLTFQPKPGKNYTMCYRVGGGGGHVLIVRNPSLRQLLSSDEGNESLRIWCPNNIDSLSPDIKKLITSFLTPDGALAFPNISMNIREDSSLRMTNSTSYGLTNQEWHGGYAVGDRERIWFQCIPISQVQIHTIQFECDFQDQGWGNRKGQLYIREDKSENEYDGPIVAISPIAEHHETPLKLTFQPKPGKNYTMCYRVGGGGGHALYVNNPCFHQLLYSDEGVESLRIE